MPHRNKSKRVRWWRLKLRSAYRERWFKAYGFKYNGLRPGLVRALLSRAQRLPPGRWHVGSANDQRGAAITYVSTEQSSGCLPQHMIPADKVVAITRIQTPPIATAEEADDYADFIATSRDNIVALCKEIQRLHYLLNRRHRVQVVIQRLDACDVFVDGENSEAAWRLSLQIGTKIYPFAYLPRDEYDAREFCEELEELLSIKEHAFGIGRTRDARTAFGRGGMGSGSSKQIAKALQEEMEWRRRQEILDAMSAQEKQKAVIKSGTMRKRKSRYNRYQVYREVRSTLRWNTFRHRRNKFVRRVVKLYPEWSA